ncbi:MucR family transcriptional regulator [Sphingomonas solaris]|uniref:MucR family transcriptional regulator n=1 Tax=Alterirhizorhabdus solaris TaxID=2529389 RepID=A0A558QSR2_9SPHN|nr:MucR family transcriptional regulator [Sphingomonas solaris]
MSENDNTAAEFLSLTTDIVAAHVGNNRVGTDELPQLIAAVHDALAGLGAPTAPEPAKQEPAVSVRASVKADYIVCLEDGKKLKMLKRYLRTNYDMSPDDYRHKWGLPSDYPMVAPNYAEKRRTLAHSIGLGRKPAAQAPVADEAEVPAEELTQAEAPAEKPRRGRPPKSEAAASAKPPARKAGPKKLKGAEAFAKVHGEPN